MKLLFSSSDSLAIKAVMDMLAWARIRHELRFDPDSPTNAQLWVQDNGHSSKAASKLTTCHGDSRQTARLLK
jgi:hypothetical protein